MGAGLFHSHGAAPAWRGGTLALLAALLFGVSTPLVQHAGAAIGPWSTAALLYAGAAAFAALQRRPPEREARLRSTDLPRLAAMAALGAALAPAALAWGLQRTSGTGASLMLTLEAVFTAVLAKVFYRESLGRRVVVAMLLLVAGGCLLVLEQGRSGESRWMGLLAVLAATAAWGGDNALSRPLAERDPAQVVMGKALLGALLSCAIAVASGESLPPALRAGALLGIGAIGYGLSLRLYLLAQREFGAARTGSVFAFAPFAGALVAWLLGDQSVGWLMAAGGALMAAGVLLHLAERHRHEHGHEAMAHEHAHSHDDGHHGHTHDPMPVEPHSHAHQHVPMRHTHDHVPDAHHTHRH